MHHHYLHIPDMPLLEERSHRRWRVWLTGAVMGCLCGSILLYFGMSLFGLIPFAVVGVVLLSIARMGSDR